MSKRNVTEVHTKSGNKFFRGSQIQSCSKGDEYDVYSDFGAELKYEMGKGLLYKDYRRLSNQIKTCKTDWMHVVLPNTDPEELEKKSLREHYERHHETTLENDEIFFSSVQKDSLIRKFDSVDSRVSSTILNTSFFSPQHDENDPFDSLLPQTHTSSTTQQRSSENNNNNVSKKDKHSASLHLKVNTKQINADGLHKTTHTPWHITSDTNKNKKLPRKGNHPKHDRDTWSQRSALVSLTNTSKSQALSNQKKRIPTVKPTSPAVDATTNREKSQVLSRKSNTTTQTVDVSFNFQHSGPGVEELHTDIGNARQFSSAGEPQHLKPYEIGFPNPPGSNRCWLNSTLQVLLGTLPFIQDLCNHQEKFANSSVLLTFMQLVRTREWCIRKNVYTALETFYRSLQVLDAMFTSSEQLDAAEFLMKLLESFSSAFENFVHGSKNCAPNAVKNNFEFILQSVASCTRCSNTFGYQETHRMLLVSAARMETRLDLQDLVESYFTTESRSCSSGCDEQCSLQTVFSQLPRFLIIQLKRYIMKDGIAQKMCHAVRIPVPLSLQRFSKNALSENAYQRSTVTRRLTEATQITASSSNTEAANLTDSHYMQQQRQPGDDEYNYKLIGTIIHKGSSLNSGHYVADVYNLQQRVWYHYNDTSVSQITEEEALGSDRQRNAYVLVYISRQLL